jgi:hypothetical protein
MPRTKLTENIVDKAVEGEVIPKAKKQKTVKIMIHKTEGDTGTLDVPVSVNGKTWLIKRGYEVEVPDFIEEALRNAVKFELGYDRETHSTPIKEMQAYPFSIVK